MQKYAYSLSTDAWLTQSGQVSLRNAPICLTKLVATQVSLFSFLVFPFAQNKQFQSQLSSRVLYILHYLEMNNVLLCVPLQGCSAGTSPSCRKTRPLPNWSSQTRYILITEDTALFSISKLHYCKMPPSHLNQTPPGKRPMEIQVKTLSNPQILWYNILQHCLCVGMCRM